jgi:spectrin alpha
MQLDELKEHWDYLLERTTDKGQKLNEASRQQRFNTSIRDFEFWLSEVIAPENGGRLEV